MKVVKLVKMENADDKQYKAIKVHFEAIPSSLYYQIG